MSPLLLLIFSAIPHTETLDDEVDLVEYNSVFDHDGKLQSDQLIFWKFGWNRGEYRYYVIDWRPINNSRILEPNEDIQKKQRLINTWWLEKNPKAKVFPVYVPEKDYQLKFVNKELIYWDRKAYRIRVIKFKVFIETQTYYDREIYDRDTLPDTERRKLRGVIR